MNNTILTAGEDHIINIVPFFSVQEKGCSVAKKTFLTQKKIIFATRFLIMYDPQ